ncbi:MAG: lambda exonuclease family protein [Acetobacteraceae bacterium]
MKIYLDHEVPQGSVQWHAIRLGIPTASRAKDVITAVKGDLSEARHKYGYQLIAERILREPFATDVGHLQWVIHGKERESEAANAYADIMGVELTKVGFVSIDSGRWGCSPDRLVLTEGVRGAAEIKAPSEVVQIGYLLEGGPGKDYRQQVQMQISVCDLNWADFFSHNERCPPLRARFHPDDAYIKKLEAALRTFADELDDGEERIRRLGLFSPAAKLANDADRMADAMIADIDRLRSLQETLDKGGDAEFVAALGTMPREQQQRVREAIEANQALLRMGA